MSAARDLATGEADRSYRSAIKSRFEVSRLRGLGIDTVDISGAVTLREPISSRMTRMSLTRPDGSVAPVMVGCTGREESRRLRASFSVATWLHGDNATPCDPGEATEAISQVYEALSEVVRWRCNWKWLKVHRCDIARDFTDVTNALPLLESLSKVPPSNARTLVWRDRACTGVETLYRHTDDWKARLYSRKASVATRRQTSVTQRDVEHDRVRFEVELRRTRLRELGVFRAADITELDVEQVATDYWKRCRFGVAVATHAYGQSTSFGETYRSSNNSDRSLIRSALGHVMLQQLGFEPPGAPATIAKVNAAIIKYGIRNAAQGPMTFVRLDVQTGRLAVVRSDDRDVQGPRGRRTW